MSSNNYDSVSIDMKERGLVRRFFSVEVLGGAVAGAALPYVGALAIKVAPTRVPLWLVAISVGGGVLLGWMLLRMVSRRHRKALDDELRKREREEFQARLERVERRLAEVSPGRSFWPKRRKPPVVHR